MWSQVSLHPREKEKKKKKEMRQIGRERERRKRVGQEKYCAYGSMENMDKALGQEAGLIAPGWQGHWMNCPWQSPRRRAAIRRRRRYDREAGGRRG